LSSREPRKVPTSRLSVQSDAASNRVRVEPLTTLARFGFCCLMFAASSLRLKIGGDAEFLPNSCFLQSRKIVLLRGGVRIAAEQESQRGVPSLRQLDDRLSCLFGGTRLLAVVVPLKSCGSSHRRIVFRMTFAKFGGTAREVCAKATGFNDGYLDAERCHFARKHLGEAFDTPLRRRIRPTSRRANPSAHR